MVRPWDGLVDVSAGVGVGGLVALVPPSGLGDRRVQVGADLFMAQCAGFDKFVGLADVFGYAACSLLSMYTRHKASYTPEQPGVHRR